MKLSNYMPTFRQVLLKQLLKEEKTAGGLFIPMSVQESKPVDEMTWEVIKTGKDCIEVKPGDTVYLSRGIYPEPVGDYFQVMEMQIKGIERDDSIRNAPSGKPKVTGSRKLQKR